MARPGDGLAAVNGWVELSDVLKSASLPTTISRGRIEDNVLVPGPPNDETEEARTVWRLVTNCCTCSYAAIVATNGKCVNLRRTIRALRNCSDGMQSLKGLNASANRFCDRTSQLILSHQHVVLHKGASFETRRGPQFATKMLRLSLLRDYNGRTSIMTPCPPFRAVNCDETSQIADLGQGWNGFQVVGNDPVDRYGTDSFNGHATQTSVPAALKGATTSARKGAK